MSKMTVKMIAAAGAVLLALGSPLLMAGDSQEKAADPAPQVCITPAGDVETSMPLEQSIKPKPSNCLPAQALTCSSMPIPVGGSCSCTSTLLPKKCKTCGTGAKGQELSTTCTVHVPCTSPPCDIQQNFSRTGRSCAS